MVQTVVVTLLFLFSAYLSNVTAQNVSSCYFCQESDNVCQDPVNVAILPAVRCEELNYITPRANVVPENGLTAQISNIMLNDVEPRSRSFGSRNYQCLKIAVTINSSDSNTVTEGVLRTCVIKADDVDSTCSFLREEITANYTITYCEVCDADKCNGSAHFSIPAFGGLLFLILVGLLFN